MFCFVEQRGGDCAEVLQLPVPYGDISQTGRWREKLKADRMAEKKNKKMAGGLLLVGLEWDGGVLFRISHHTRLLCSTRD